MSIIAESPHSPSTAPAPVEEAPRWTDARDQMIHASALQEHIIASGPVLPTRIEISRRHGRMTNYQFPLPETDIVIYLHHDLPGVRAFQGFLGGVLQESLLTRVDHRPQQVQAVLRGQAFGCVFRVESQDDAPQAGAR